MSSRAAGRALPASFRRAEKAVGEVDLLGPPRVGEFERLDQWRAEEAQRAADLAASEEYLFGGEFEEVEGEGKGAGSENEDA